MLVGRRPRIAGGGINRQIGQIGAEYVGQYYIKNTTLAGRQNRHSKLHLLTITGQCRIRHFQQCQLTFPYLHWLGCGGRRLGIANIIRIAQIKIHRIITGSHRWCNRIGG